MYILKRSVLVELAGHLEEDESGRISVTAKVTDLTYRTHVHHGRGAQDGVGVGRGLAEGTASSCDGRQVD